MQDKIKTYELIPKRGYESTAHWHVAALGLRTVHIAEEQLQDNDFLTREWLKAKSELLRLVFIVIPNGRYLPVVNTGHFLQRQP